MNVEQQIGRLESLLAKIRLNAAALADARGAGSAVTVDQPIAASVAPIATQAAAPTAQNLQVVETLHSHPARESQIPMSASPHSTEEVTDEDFVTIPPAAPDAQLAPRKEIRSGLHSVLDPLPEDEHALDAASRASEIPAVALTSSEAPDSAMPATNARPSYASDPRSAPDFGEEVTGERPAVSASDEHLHEAAVRTPPPESGPQVSLPPGLGYNNNAPTLAFSDEPISSHTDGPTMEQLGSTVDLDAGAETLDLQVEPTPRRSSWPPSEEEELEAAIPSRRFAGTYDASLVPPPTAQAELDAHDRAERDRVERHSSRPAAPELYSQPPPASAPSAHPEAQAWARPNVLTSTAAASYEAGPKLSPKSFLDLLDASLSLRKG